MVTIRGLSEKLDEKPELLENREVQTRWEKMYRHCKYSLGFLVGSAAGYISSMYFLLNDQKEIYIPLLLTSVGLYIGFDELRHKVKEMASSIEEIIKYKVNF